MRQTIDFIIEDEKLGVWDGGWLVPIISCRDNNRCPFLTKNPTWRGEIRRTRCAYSPQLGLAARRRGRSPGLVGLSSHVSGSTGREDVVLLLSEGRVFIAMFGISDASWTIRQAPDVADVREGIPHQQWCNRPACQHIRRLWVSTCLRWFLWQQKYKQTANKTYEPVLSICCHPRGREF